MQKIYTLLFLFTCQTVWAQFDSGAYQCATGKHDFHLKSLKNARPSYPGDATIDIIYYKLDLGITYNPNFIDGHVQVNFEALNPISSLVLDLKNTFLVDSITLGNTKLQYTHVSNKLNISIGSTLVTGSKTSIVVHYRGVPPKDENGGFFFETHGSRNEAVISSLSEPYGAPDWWPCKDDPSDKADSTDIWLTMPTFFTAVSNGKLMSTAVNNNGTRTFKWKTNYPIAHYLISVAASNYTSKNAWFKYAAADSMPIANYLYPEILSNTQAMRALDLTPSMLKIFSDKFGLYPFIKEKYGHAMFNFGGGMEHQTISSMGGFSNGLVAHELAHQWFGDKVTCKTWHDIWVNEGFATYSEALYAENATSREAYTQTMKQYMDLAKQAVGSVYVENINSVDAIFNFHRTYAKGASILHMLRGVTGDDLFFKILQNYANGTYAFDAAGIDDFKKVAESVTSSNLGYFFDQWLYGKGYPKYQFGWSPIQSGSLFGAALNITNTGSNASTSFKMPVQLRVTLVNGQKEQRIIMIDQKDMKIEIVGFNQPITLVEFDPDNLILKDLALVPGLVTSTTPQANKSLSIYPNPAIDILNLDTGNQPIRSTQIYNMSGQLLASNNTNNNQLDIASLKPGKYLLQLQIKDRIQAIQFIKK